MSCSRTIGRAVIPSVERGTWRAGGIRGPGFVPPIRPSPSLPLLMTHPSSALRAPSPLVEGRRTLDRESLAPRSGERVAEGRVRGVSSTPLRRHRAVSRLGMTTLFAALATFVNPYGWRVYEQQFAIAGNRAYRAMLDEWLVPRAAVLALIAVVLIIVIARLRRVPLRR